MMPRHKLDVRRQIISPSNPRELKARQNYQLHQRALRFRAEGYSIGEAVELAGSSRPTFWRLEKRVSREGIDGYEPRTANCGRPSDLARLRVPQWIFAAVEGIAVQRNCGIRAAWKTFAKTPDCPPRLSMRLRKSVPKSFIRATSLRTITVRLGVHLSQRFSLAAALKGEPS
jgi:hypothetical protein